MLVFLKGDHRALLLQDYPARQRSPTVDQRHPYNDKLIPLTAAIQSQINRVPLPVRKSRLRQAGVVLRQSDPGGSSASGQIAAVCLPLELLQG